MRVAFLLGVLLLGAAWPARGDAGVDMEDCGRTPDAGDAREGGLLVEVPITCSGWLRASNADHTDWYLFHVPAGAMVDVTLAGSLPIFCLWTPDGAVDCPESRNIWRRADVAGTYALELGHGFQMDMGYSFTLVLGPDDCGSGRDAADERGAAERLPTRVSCRADFTPGETVDWWRVPLLAGQRVYVNQTLAASEALVEFCLFAPGSGAPADCGVHDGGGANRLEHLVATTGSWSLRAEGATSPYRYGFTLAVVGGSAADCGAQDAGGSPATARALARNATCSGTVLGAPEDAEDWFRVLLPAGAQVDARATPQPFPVELCLFGPANESACAADGTALAFTTLSQGAWLARVRAPEQVAPYALRVGAIVPGDCGTPEDASSEAPLPLGAVLACDGVLPVGDTNDALLAPFRAGESIVATLTPTGGDARVCWLTDSPGACSSRASAPRTLVTGPLSGGTRVLFDVQPAAGHAAMTYALRLERHASDDCGWGTDANPTANNGMTGSCAGSFVPGDAVDAYRVFATAGMQHTVRVTTPGTIEACLQHADGTARSCTGPFTGERSMPWTAAGSFELHLLSLGSTTTYAFSATAIAPPDCTGVEAGDTFEEATPYPLALLGASTCAGLLWLAADDAKDWYRLDAPLGHGVLVSVDERLPQFELCAYAADGSTFRCAVPDLVRGGVILPLPPAVEPWRLRVYADDRSLPYTFQVRTL